MEVIRLLRTQELKPPYGGVLVDLRVYHRRAQELHGAARDLSSLDLTARQIADLELFATGAFSPLTGFLGRADYERVCTDMRLSDGRLWPMPLVLDVTPAMAATLTSGQRVALRDGEGTMLAVLTIAEIWERELEYEAECIYSTCAAAHPEVRELQGAARTVCLAGKLEVTELPVHHDFAGLRATPAALRRELLRQGERRLIGYPVERLLHRAHVEFTQRMARLHNAPLLIQGLIGRRYLNQADHYPLVRAWRAALTQYPASTARLNLIELSSRLCGPRAALWQAIVSRNYGCTHYIGEHDCAGFGAAADGAPRYGEFQSLEALRQHAPEIGLEIIPWRELVYEEDHPEHFIAGRPISHYVHAPSDPDPAAPGPEHRDVEIARWFSYAAVLHEWQKSYRLRSAQGLTIFFTGLSGAGKSTIAQLLHARLMETGERPATLLDGDIVRKHLSAGLGFSREHRDMNVLRLGYVASLIVRHGGISLCAPIAPYAATRAQVRALIAPHGGFIEVYVATSLNVCEARDRKGLYARARAGLIKEFTGVSDPYEPPTAAEIVIDTAEFTAEEAVEQILAYLVREGYLVETPERESAEVDGEPADAGRRDLNPRLWPTSPATVDYRHSRQGD
jgi:sulfate adenylyltransferase